MEQHYNSLFVEFKVSVLINKYMCYLLHVQVQDKQPAEENQLDSLNEQKILLDVKYSELLNRKSNLEKGIEENFSHLEEKKLKAEKAMAEYLKLKNVDINNSRLY